MTPLFSIIIPVYNVEKYLRDCLDSVLDQTRQDDCEVICINDGSTDECLNILNEYKLRYKNLIVIDQTNSGTAVARNAGLKIAKGEYIWFVDSDDWILPDALSTLNAHLQNNRPEILCFNGKLKYEDTGREERDDGTVENSLTGWEYYNKYALQSKKFHFVCVVLRLYKRDFLFENNLLFEPGISHEDNLWIPQVMYYAKSVDCIADELYVYRIRSGSKMQTTSKEKLFDIIKVANKLSDFFIPKTDIDKKKIYRDLATYYPNVLVMSSKYDFPNITMECYERFDLNNYKIISKDSFNRVYYYLMKFKSSIIFFYPQISKIFRKLSLF